MIQAVDTREPRARYVPRAFDGSRLGELRARFVDVLERLGFEPRVRGTEHNPKTRLRCPFHEERTPSLDVSRGLFNCFGCGASGDVFAFVGKLEGLSFVASVHRVAGILGVDPDSLLEGSKASMTFAPATLGAPLRSREEGSKEKVRKAPSVDELRAFWDACSPVTSDELVSEWLVRRGLVPARVEDGGFARALPATGPSSWFTRLREGHWTATGHRLVLPVFDSKGELRGLRGRLIVSGSELPKSVGNAGPQKGLVLACSLGRLMLTGAALANGKPAHELVRRVGLVITEGEPDFLKWASHFSDGDEDARAVFGVPGANFWAPEIADRVPDGTNVYVRQHADDAGGRLLANVLATLKDRCSIRARKTT